jgi:phosphate:Na+ symporter
MMSHGLQGSAGNNMRNVLKKLTNNRFIAVGIGALITSIIQSSSATNVMLVSFVDSQLMKFKQTIGIILGAAIGTTFTVQIIAFKFTDYALIFVSFGLALHYISKNYKISEIGKGILGFGILFFGMHVMSEAMSPLRTYQPFIEIILSLEAPLIGILVGVFFTALIQSSGAFIGILIILSMQSLLSLDAAISLTIGANIGTAITAILASINTTREARQVALAHTLIKIVGAAIILSFIPSFTHFIQSLDSATTNGSFATPRQIANAHTIYNIALCLAFLPFTNSVAWLVNKIYPVGIIEEDKVLIKYLDDSLFIAPTIAVDAARKELIRLMKEVEKMTAIIIKPFFEKDTTVFTSIETSEEKVNFLRDNINEYLVRLSRSDISEDTIEEAFTLMNAVREFEQIADVISTQLLKKAKTWCSGDFEFSEIGKKELKEYHLNTQNIIKKAIKVYQTLDIKKALKLKDKYYIYREEYFEFERQHYDRLKDNIEHTVASSKTHLELITLMRVISSHATNTARIIIYRTSKTPKKKKKKKK